MNTTSGAPGWYQDPLDATDPTHLRYWDGTTWTANTAVAQLPPTMSPALPAPATPIANESLALPAPHKANRRLPKWLPLPVAIVVPFTIAYLIFCTVKTPLSPLLALAPLVFVGLPLYLVDRLAPHPIYARLSMLLWGATVSLIAALVLEAPAALITHSNMVVVFVAGPVEELAIFSGLWWLCHRRDVTTVLDSVLLVSWCALGFAIIEDAGYFASAPHHQLVAVFIGRTIITPFGHPLFSSLSAVGYVMYRRRHQIRWLLGGLAAAAALHTTWDATLVWVAENEKHHPSAAAIATWIFLIAFAGIFATWVILVFIARAREHRRQVFRLPHLVRYIGLPDDWTDVLATLPAMRAYRSTLTRPARAGFDDIISTMTSMSHRAPDDPLQIVLAQTARDKYRAWTERYFFSTQLPTKPTKDDALTTEAGRVLATNDRGNYTVPRDKLYPAQWLWDAGFIALGLVTKDPSRALLELETVTSGQWSNGMLPHIVFLGDDPTYFPGPAEWGTQHAPPTSGITQPPVLGSVLARIAGAGADQERVRVLWDKLVENHRWWHKARDPESTGLVCIYHPWESGMDNSPSFDAPLARVSVDNLPTYLRRDLEVAPAKERPTKEDYDRYWSLVVAGREMSWDLPSLYEKSEFCVVDPLTNALLIRSERDLAVLGRYLGAPEAACTQLELWAAAGANGLETLWDSALGHYRTRDLRDGRRFCGPATIASLIAVWSGVLGEDRVSHLAAEARAWATSAGTAVPSLDPSSEQYDPDRYWRGAVWINTNWLLAEGLAACGEIDTATWLRQESLDLVAQTGCYEYFNPASKKGRGGSDFSWTAALVLEWLHSAKPTAG